MNIKYKIKFYSDWHCGSGLSSGTDLDLLIIKDKADLPFVPGKTIKGLLLEAVEEINEFSGRKFDTDVQEVFGVFDSKEKAKQGCCFFTNATENEVIGRRCGDMKILVDATQARHGCCDGCGCSDRDVYCMGGM